MNKNITIYNLYDTFYCYKVNNDRLCEDAVSEHMLVHICSGEMILEIEGKDTVLHKGDAFFLKRNHLIKRIKQPSEDGEGFSGLFLVFKTPFLKKFYSEHIVTTAQGNNIGKNLSLVMLETHPLLDALFTSLDFYAEAELSLSEELMETKLKEAVLVLLKLKPELVSVLFDFAKPWKIDLEEFMIQNYTCDLPLEQLAHYTGRSLTVFKQDFARIFNDTPSRWLIKKRLEEALILMNKKSLKPSDVYLEVGFKNFSHFSKAFKKEYGYPPSAITEKA